MRGVSKDVSSLLTLLVIIMFIYIILLRFWCFHSEYSYKFLARFKMKCKVKSYK